MIPLPLPPGPPGPAPVAYVVDLSSVARPLFHVLPPAQTEDGEPVAVTAAMALRLVRLIVDHHPAFLFVCADQPTAIGDQEDPADARRRRYHRARIWPGYKAERTPPGPEYDAQYERLLEILRAHEIPVLRGEGWEADDFAAQLAQTLAGLGMRVVVVSQDQDLWQCADGQDGAERIVIWDGKSTEATTAADVEAVYKVPAALLPVVMALAGDKDEAPGLDGIGFEKAAALVQRHRGEALAVSATLERVLSRWQWEAKKSGQPSKIGEALRDGVDVARLSLRLVELPFQAEGSVCGLVTGGRLGWYLVAGGRLGWSEVSAHTVRRLGEELDIAILRCCEAMPKRPLPEALVAEMGLQGWYR